MYTTMNINSFLAVYTIKRNKGRYSRMISISVLNFDGITFRRHFQKPVLALTNVKTVYTQIQGVFMIPRVFRHTVNNGYIQAHSLTFSLLSPLACAYT